MAAGKLLSRTGHVAPPAWFSWGSKISAPEKRLGRGFKTPSRVGVKCLDRYVLPALYPAWP